MTAVKVAQGYLWVVFMAIFIFVSTSLLNRSAGSDSLFNGSSQELEVGLVFLAGSIFYLVTVKWLFFTPLNKHRDWVIVNGIFSTKPKALTLKEPTSSIDIIRGENLKLYSVADELSKWAKLKDDGHISEEDFNQAKDKLLK